MPDTDPVAHAKALKLLARIMVLTGLIIGVGLPVLFMMFEIQVAMTPWGFDAMWLAPLAIMIFDFVLARMFWRRAIALEQSAMQGKAAPAR
jgi:hypothetical protein